LAASCWYFGDGYSTKTHKGLTEFFGHSDCDGEISPEMCKIVADELEAILPYVEELAKKEMPHGHILRDGGYIIRKGDRLAQAVIIDFKVKRKNPG